MTSTEAQTQNQSQQSIIYDERIRQLTKTSIIDAIVPKQISLYHQQHRDQCCSSTNDIRTITFDRFPLWNNHSSAWTFCGRTPDEASVFTNQHQSTLYSSSRSLLNTHHQEQQHHHYRPYFTSSSAHLPSAATIITPSNNNTNSRQRSSSSSSSLSTNNTSTTTDYQSCFTNHLSTTSLSSTAPTDSHDQIASNTNKIAPVTFIDVMGQSSSTSAVLSRNTSTVNTQPQQFVTMTHTTKPFFYIPASGSLVYNNLTGPNRSTTIPHH